MKIKTLLKNCAINPPNVVISLLFEKEWLDIELWGDGDYADFIATYGYSDVYHWTIENIDTDTYVIFSVKTLVRGVKPTTKAELKEIIEETIEKEGVNCDLNFIDVSNIEDMTGLFDCSQFNGDISKWDVSNVKDMKYMFFESKFNGDISKWDVSNVKNMDFMFFSSHFNNDISNWDVSNVRKKSCMFGNCPLENNPPDWCLIVYRSML